MVNRDYFFMPHQGDAKKENPDPCRCCGVQNCEITAAYAVDCKIKGTSVVECGRENVSEGIGEHCLIDTQDNYKIAKNIPDQWEPCQAVFISAQTGQGKNHFVEKTLIPHVKHLNYEKNTDQKVLIISNRLALRLQIESRLNSNGGLQDTDEDRLYSRPCADIITYQGFLKKSSYFKRKQEQKKSRYIFIVCDEAHFFTSDAMFNVDTGKILTNLITIFQAAVRIYMSATPHECISFICDYEARCKKTSERRIGDVAFYHFTRDYSYLDTKYFSDYDELVNLIIDQKTGKWMIFIDDKRQGEALRDRLIDADAKNTGSSREAREKAEARYYAVSADSKKDERYQKMVLAEKFDKDLKALITTSVLDNGVNFRGIRNVVAGDISIIKLQQMVGRARVDETTQSNRVTLYIKRLDARYVERRLQNLEEQREAYHHYDLAFGNPLGTSYSTDHFNSFIERYYRGTPHDWENAKHWFGGPISPLGPMLLPPQDHLYYNEIARSMSKTLVPCYESILQNMRSKDNGQEASGQKHLESQLAWFGKSYDTSNDLTLSDAKQNTEKLTGFLECYAMHGTKLFNEDSDPNVSQSVFRESLTKLCSRAFGKQDPNKRNHGLAKLNKIFEAHEIGYKLESLQDTTAAGKRQYWQVVRHNWGS